VIRLYRPTSKFFRKAPILIDDAGVTYFYFAWDYGSTWLIRRQVRGTSTTSDAIITYNSGYSSLTEAWADRGILVYE
jgi:hypothetical protein